MLTNRSFLLAASTLHALTATGFLAPACGDYTIDDVPDEILSLRIKDNRLCTDVLSAGPKAGTGLTPEQAENKGLTKNHWVFRVLANVRKGGKIEPWQIQFSMDVDLASLDSIDTLYAGTMPKHFSDPHSPIQ